MLWGLKAQKALNPKRLQEVGAQRLEAFRLADRTNQPRSLFVEPKNFRLSSVDPTIAPTRLEWQTDREASGFQAEARTSCERLWAVFRFM